MSVQELTEPRRHSKIKFPQAHKLKDSECAGDQKQLAARASPATNNLHDWCIMCINTLRDPIAEIQEKRGISRHQRFTFVDLMTALFNHSYNSCMCILTMIMGLLPLLEGLLNLVRFILDKMLEIDECQNIGEKFCKTCIFVGEMFVIFVIVSLIVTIILLPVAHLIQYSLCKIWRLAN